MDEERLTRQELGGAETDPPAEPPPHQPEDLPDGGVQFTARPAEKIQELPQPQDHYQLRLATSAMVQQGLSLEQAASNYGVDPDTLHVWHRTYINFVGKDAVAVFNVSAAERVEIDPETNKKFDENGDAMLQDWERLQHCPGMIALKYGQPETWPTGPNNRRFA